MNPQSIRLFGQADVPAALSLMRATLGEGRMPRSEAFFRWKHLENPNGPSLGFVVDDDGGAIRALRLFQRWGLSKQGFPVSAVRAVDTATAKAAQGQGLFKALTLRAVDAAAADTVDVVFNTPNAKSGAGYLKMGWHEVGTPGVWLRPGLPLPAAVGRRLRMFDVDDGPVDPEELANIASSCASGDDERLQTRRDAAYLRWRYLAIPGFRYRQVRVGGAAAVVRQQRRRGVPELTVAELFVPGGGRGAMAAIRLLHRMAGMGAALVSLMPSSRRVAALAAASGFVRFPAGPRVFVRPVQLLRVERLPATLDDWSFSIGDLEIF